MRKTSNFRRLAGWLVSTLLRLDTKQRIVDGMRIGLDIPRVSCKHRAYGLAGVLRLKREEHVIAIGKRDEKGSERIFAHEK